MARRYIKLTVQYDGSEYHGWQTQPGFKTIQAALKDAIESLPDTKARVHGASRTDAGVSALGQVALAVIDSPIPTENLQKAINDRLESDIAVLEVSEAPPGFDLMGGATSKLYRYTIYTGPVRPVLQIRHCWHLPGELDVAAMGKAAGLLVGEKDFKSFATAGDKRENTVRTIFRCDVVCEDNWIYVDVEGDAFLYNMVRNVVGILVEVGVGRCDPERMTEILNAKDRRAAGPIAPAGGLCLMWIKY
ncbi:MAG: tRNA pseudouridine(38-40) synthase TruA [Planctomycetota bacterium]|jgi:tRNA pseudouridine38-40 synthase